MKKIVVFILAILYLGLSTGATIHMHYCMGKLVGSALWHNTSNGNNKCSNCGMVKSKKKCCKDEHKHLQIEKDQNLNESFSQKIQMPDVAIINTHYQFQDIVIASVINSIPQSNAPPENLPVPIYLYNCVFRI
jgi:hypothetical protein